MLHYYKFHADVFDPRPALEAYVKRPAGKGWPEQCPPMRQANAFGWDILSNFALTFVKDEQGTFGLTAEQGMVGDWHLGDADEADGASPAEGPVQHAAWFWDPNQTLPHPIGADVYEAIKPDVHLASMSGGTDLCGCLVIGNPTMPVHAGEIQVPALGLEIDVVDEDGATVPTGTEGELVCRTPFPSTPLRFWDDPGATRFDAAYFDRFPGVWHHGDFVSRSANGGYVISGRSDATLNPGGVRIGTAEIYRRVDTMPEIDESVVVGQPWANDTRIVLFVKMADGHELDDDLREEIRRRIRREVTPRHVPAVIAAVADIPRTRSGKITELAVRDVVVGREIKNVEALANPEALEHFRQRPELDG